MSNLENMTKEELIKIILRQSELLRRIDKKTKREVRRKPKQFNINEYIEENEASWNAVIGALRDCINAHGPITRKLIGSAAKRIVGMLYTEFSGSKDVD